MAKVNMRTLEQQVLAAVRLMPVFARTFPANRRLISMDDTMEEIRKVFRRRSFYIKQRERKAVERKS